MAVIMQIRCSECGKELHRSDEAISSHLRSKKNHPELVGRPKKQASLRRKMLFVKTSSNEPTHTHEERALMRITGVK